jgi:peptidoglycan-associated lipoprotein
MKKILIVFATLLLVACNTTKTVAPDVSGSGKAAVSSPDKSNSGVAAKSAMTHNADIESRKIAADKLNAEKLASDLNEIQKLSVYFDFDKSEIKPEYQDVLKRQAAFMMAHSNDSVTVLGNADERGSDEYNLALGDRRANTARKFLELLGVPAARISTKSLGEEKPRLTCHEEKCWKENRRDDFVHKY